MVELTTTRLAGTPDSRTLLVVGPSLGTSVEALWTRCAARLADEGGGEWEVLGWDLPGHGRSPAADGPFSVDDLAAAVRERARAAANGRAVHYAGVSLGGAVGLALALAPGPFVAVATLASAPRIGDTGAWHERAELVRRAGTAVMVEGSTTRWFAPGFPERQPQVAHELLTSLRAADDDSYAFACEALADFDLRDRIGDSRVPLLVAAGEHDVVVTPEHATAAVPGATHAVVAGCGHLPPAEDPGAVAALLAAFLSPSDAEIRHGDPHRSGMAVRRAVLGDAHVDRAIAGTTGFTRDFQAFITRYAWGEVWTRPGLDRRTRSVVTLTALVAGGHWDELSLHVRAAVRNGLTVDEIGEVILQTGVYCGVPAANHAFRVAQEALGLDP